jgi:glycosyltransferase involved in cell wall biosynthesis
MRAAGDLPLVSVGIPTYNRAHFLRESLATALAQTYPNVEVVVSDNASPDDTPRVVEEVGNGRLRYHRNGSNIGSAANFLKALELASGEYFAWLQDDDLLHCDFVRRGVEALHAAPGAVAYLAFSLSTPDIRFVSSVQHPFLYGPAYPLDWVSGGARQFPGSVITPLSLFLTMSMPPTTLFRTEQLRRHADAFLDPRTPLLNERTLLSRLASDRDVIAEPYIGGIFRQHMGQHSYLEQLNGQALPTQWRIMADTLDGIRNGQADRHDELLAEIFGRFADGFIVEYYHRLMQSPGNNRLLGDVAGLLRRVAAERGLDLDPSPRRARPTVAGRAKEVVRGCTPPFVWAALRRLARRPAGRGG